MDHRQNNGSVKAVPPRHYAATSALHNCCFNCCTGQSHKDNVRCTAVEEQLKAREVQLSQPSSTSLLMTSFGLTCSPWARYRPPPPGSFGDNDFWIARYVSFQYLLVCKMNYSAFRDYLRWYIAAESHVLKWACPLQIPNNWQLYHCLDTQKYCTCWYQWVALLLRLLLSYPGMVG